MNIDRNNYEEYFLLYADNELTDSEKVEVIMFLKQNKDLEEEFRMIHYSISKPDASVKLADKSFLLRKNEESFINEKNYEEVFVLYHDNELTENEKLETEEFLFHHAQLKNEFDLIGLARLTPEDAVIFPKKKQLYKKGKTGKVVPVIFWRALVAAVFIGSGLWITQLYIQNGERKSGVAVQSIPAKQIAPVPVIGKIVLPEKKQVNTIVHASGQNSQPSRKEINGKGKLQKSLSQKNTNNYALAKTSVKIQKPDQENLTNQYPEKINNEADIANQQIKNIPKEQISEDSKNEPSKELAQNAIQTDENVQPVKYTQNSSDVSDANDNGQNYVFYDITTEEFKKTKVGGFLKKVKRLIERNNPISRLISGEERQVASN
jgi:hypothetical protein